MEEAVNSLRAFGNSKGYLLAIQGDNIVCIEKENLFKRILMSIFGTAQPKPDLGAVVRRCRQLLGTGGLATALSPIQNTDGPAILKACGDRLHQLGAKNPGQNQELNDAIRALNLLLPPSSHFAEIATPPQMLVEEEEEEMGAEDPPEEPAVEVPLETGVQEQPKMDVEDPVVKAHRKKMLAYQIGDLRYLPLLDLHCLHEKSYPNPYLFQKAFAMAAGRSLEQLNLERMSPEEIKEIEKRLESDEFIVHFSELLLRQLKRTKEGSPEERILDKALNALNQKVLNDKLRGLTREQKADFLGGQKPEWIIDEQSPKEILERFSACERIWALEQENLLIGVWKESDKTDSLEDFREKFIFVAHQVLHPRDKNRYTLDPNKISKAEMGKILTGIKKLD